MGAKQTRDDAITTLIASMRAIYITGTAEMTTCHTALLAANAGMSGVSENTITAQQVTDVNAAITSAYTAQVNAVAQFDAMLAALNTANAGLRTE